jgi:hypothetical protein
VEFPKLQYVDDAGVVINQIDLITDFLEVYDTLYRRNSNVTHIVTTAFASNAL